MTDALTRGIFSMTPGRCRIVYLDEISVEGLTIADVENLRKEYLLLWRKN